MRSVKMNKIKALNPTKINKMNKKQVIHLHNHKITPTLRT